MSSATTGTSTCPCVVRWSKYALTSTGQISTCSSRHYRGVPYPRVCRLHAGERDRASRSLARVSLDHVELAPSAGSGITLWTEAIPARMHLVGGGLFGGLDDDARRGLRALMRRRRFARGQVIFHEGDPGDTLHLIVKGHVSIKTSTPRASGDPAGARPRRRLRRVRVRFASSARRTGDGARRTETMMLDRESFTALRKERRRCADTFLHYRVRRWREGADGFGRRSSRRCTFPWRLGCRACS